MGFTDWLKNEQVKPYRKVKDIRGDACRKCGSTEHTEVHHKNRNRNDNSYRNLEVLCRDHHLAAHGKKRRK